MKIGIDIRTLMDAQYSGVPEYTLKLLSEIFKLDHSNEYRLFYNSARDISARMPKFEHQNVRVVKTSYPNKLLNYVFFKIFGRPEIDKMLDVDLVFLPHMNFIGLSGNAKSILTVHDLSFLRHPEYFSLRKNFWHHMINVRSLLQKARKIVAVSENTKKDIIDLCGIPGDRIETVYSGIGKGFRRIDKSDAGLEALRKKYSLPGRFILFLGTIEPRKNIDGLIRSFDILKNGGKCDGLKLIIAGGKGWKGGEISDAWQRSPFKDDIIFLGYIGDEEKAYLYNLATIFVYPSFYEGFGFPPLEAMACGTPVVTSISSSLPEIVGDAGLLVDPKNINDLSRAMAALLEDGKMRDELSQKGLARARQFDWTQAAERYVGLFNDSCNI